ncbi:MAG: hypothetical protein D6689_16345 [Deltaproteobacteria bacterium]|nr:MAG: hypothetical protein D6689_16345 [Deltaproteobacteria bacterium]
MDHPQVVVTAETVERTIATFTALDQAGDKRTMTKLARRLGKDQPALLRFAARLKDDHGDAVGEAAVFYGTLVWAMFETQFGKKLHRLTQANLEAAREVVAAERAKIDGLDARPVHERTAPALVDRQPHVYAKLVELVEEDVREGAMAEETAALIFEPTQVIVEAFDAAMAGRRPGQRLGPVVRETPKVGRNDPCPCGSGKKYKRCCGAA